MAIYHFSAKMISRANGSSALAAAAYRSGSRLYDQRLDRNHDFSNKAGVVHSELLLPDGAPEHLGDRARLWNAVEAAELRKDAQLAREIEFAIPRELTDEHGIALARDFVKAEFVDRGMIADLNVHRDIGADGQPKPHAHVMLTTRKVSADGFGAKNRDWNRSDLLERWRERWAEHVNARLAELDIDVRIDHRSLEAQGIDLTPQHKIGPAASRMAAQGLDRERVDEHLEIARSNGAKILADPGIALDAITRTQATFTTRDLAMFVHRHSEGKEQFDQVMAAVRSSPDLVALGRDGRGNERFSSRDMIATEQRLERATIRLADRAGHGLPTAAVERAIAAAGSNGLDLGGEQQAALDHIVRPNDLAIVTGYAGTGKSAMLSVARDAWEHAGYSVRGAALSGIAAENLEHGSGIASRTIASLEHHWARGDDLLTSRDVLVIDEAGMIGTRQLERVVVEAEKRGAKVVIVGDPEQLQAIEAGAAFRAAAERHGCVEITEIRRQREDWQRDATRHLATGRTAEAVAAYDQHGAVRAAATREQARADLIDCWDSGRVAAPEASRIILTHTNDEVGMLNGAARERLRRAGLIGDDIAIATERGGRRFAHGDRVMFLRNDRELGVKNGSLGSVQSVSTARMAVMLDDGRAVAFDLKDYAQVDHGYATTIHKAQGMTVDRVHVLATPGLDRHSAYVALSRHRDRVELHYGRDDFGDQGKLIRTVSRERSKNMASDYVRDFADRRQILVLDVPAAEVAQAPGRNSFAGLRLQRAQPSPDLSPSSGLPTRTQEPQALIDNKVAVVRHARAVDAIFARNDRSRRATPDQITELKAARTQLAGRKADAPKDLEAVYSREPALAAEAAGGNVRRAIAAMRLEAELRTNPLARADQFVERWKGLAGASERAYVAGDYAKHHATRAAMTSMAEGLQRDPQMESILANRKRELGISFETGRSIAGELAFSQGLDLGRGRGLGR